MIVALLSNPKTSYEWAQWSWNHRLSHDAIRAAVLAQRKITLIDYQIEPIEPKDMLGFLQRNAQLHIEMNAVVKAKTVDLQEVNFEDERQKQAWIWLHYLEHQTAENILKISA